MADMIHTDLEAELQFWLEYITASQQKAAGQVPTRAWDALERAKLRLTVHLLQQELESGTEDRSAMH